MRIPRRIPTLIAGSAILMIGLAVGAGVRESDAGRFRQQDGTAPIAQQRAPRALNGKTPPKPSGVSDLGRKGQLQPDNPGAPRATIQTVSGPNIRFSRDNSDFAQNETSVAISPTNLHNVVGGANDYRIGIGQSGFYSSPGSGTTDIKTVNGTDADGILPMVNTGWGEAWDGGGDPAVDFDANGRVYFAGLFFQRTAGTPYTDCRSGIAVYSSDNMGLTWTRPSLASGSGIVAAVTTAAPDVPIGSPTDCSVFHDKEYLAVDRYSTGAKRNNIYVTWTRFRYGCNGADYCEGPIYFSQSSNGGVTWSTPLQISGVNAALCQFGDFYDGALNPNACNFDQFSVPVVGSDGTVYVSFYNTNTAAQNQFLLVKCAAASDCTQAASWTAPVKIGDVYDINLPFNVDGRQTLSNSQFRSGAIVSNIALDRTTMPNRMFATWWDNRNGGSNASGNGASGGTDTDIFVAISTDGGATWGAAIKVNQDTSRNDQFQPWIAVSPSPMGRAPAMASVCVSYYDRRSDPGNKTNGVFASCSINGGTTWTDQKLNDTPQNLADLGGFSAGNGQSRFIGDYTGLAVGADGYFFALWTDTRNSTASVKQTDIYGTYFDPFGNWSPSQGGGR